MRVALLDSAISADFYSTTRLVAGTPEANRACCSSHY